MEPLFLYDEEFNTREKELKKILDFSLKKNYTNKNALFLKKLIYSAILNNKPKIHIKAKPQTKQSILQNPQISSLIKSHIQDKQQIKVIRPKQIPIKTDIVSTSKLPKQFTPTKIIQKPIPKPTQKTFTQPIQQPLPQPSPNISKVPIPQVQIIPRPPIQRQEMQLPKLEIEIPKFGDTVEEVSPIPIIEEPTPLDSNLTRNSDGSLIYNVKELTIDPKTYRVFYALQNRLFTIIEKSPALLDNQDFFTKNLKDTLKILNMNIQEIDIESLKTYLRNYIFGFHKLQQLILDTNIKAIYCYGANQPLIIQHIKYGKIQTNLNFNSNTELDDFIKYIAKKAGKIISTSMPTINVTFPNGIKFEATIGGDFASSKFILIK